MKRTATDWADYLTFPAHGGLTLKLHDCQHLAALLLAMVAEREALRAEVVALTPFKNTESVALFSATEARRRAEGVDGE
jgi:hypothetical protein